jgi:hypothetical protein
MTDIDELKLGTPWSKSGQKVTAPPIRVPVDGNELACTIGIAGKGQSIPNSFLKLGEQLPASAGHSVGPVRAGQSSATLTILAIHADGQHVPLAVLRVDGWERDARYLNDPLFELDLRVVHRKDPDGSVNGWMELAFTGARSSDQLEVTSIDPERKPGKVTGTVRSEIKIPVADVTLLEDEDRLRARVQKREPFQLELDDGRTIRVDPAGAPLEELDTIRNRGVWDVVRNAFGAFLVFPEVSFTESDEGRRFVVCTREVCAGDRVSIVSAELSNPGADFGLREIRADDIVIEKTGGRDAAEVTPAERERYRVDEPPSIPKRRNIMAEMREEDAKRKAEAEESARRWRPLTVVASVLVVVAVVGFQFWPEINRRFFQSAEGHPAPSTANPPTAEADGPRPARFAEQRWAAAVASANGPLEEGQTCAVTLTDSDRGERCNVTIRCPGDPFPGTLGATCTVRDGVPFDVTNVWISRRVNPAMTVDEELPIRLSFRNGIGGGNIGEANAERRWGARLHLTPAGEGANQ